MAPKQGLVGSHDMLARAEGRLVDFGSGMLAADKLDDDVDFVVSDDIVPIVREVLTGDAGCLRLLPDEAARAFDLEIDAVCRDIFVVMGDDGARDAAADGSEADKADVYGAQGFRHGYAPFRVRAIATCDYAYVQTF